MFYCQYFLQKYLTVVNTMCYNSFQKRGEISMNFQKEEFSKILKNICDSYGSINKMANKSGVTAS